MTVSNPAMSAPPSVGAPEPRPLSWWPHPMPVRVEGPVRFLMDASFCSLPLYFALKGKHDYAMVNQAPFIEAVRERVAEVAGGYDLVVYPESRFPFLRQVTEGLANAAEMRKRSKAEVCVRTMGSRKWSKLERQSQERAFSQMGDAFTINLIKSNQRQHYAPHLFEGIAVAPGARVLLLDDFIMSGMTLQAMSAALGLQNCDAFGVFYQVPAAIPVAQ